MGGIMAMTGTLWGYVRDVGSGIISTLKNALAPVVNVGRSLVEGIWQGISSSYTWIKDKISGWVGNVVDFIKRLFGIGSPSKVMADEIGEWLPPGIAQGFEQTMPGALEAMRDSLSGAVDELKENLTFSAGGLTGALSASGTGSAGGGDVNFTQIINSPKALDRLTLYRQTNGLLFAAKVRMDNV